MGKEEKGEEKGEEKERERERERAFYEFIVCLIKYLSYAFYLFPCWRGNAIFEVRKKYNIALLHKRFKKGISPLLCIS